MNLSLITGAFVLGALGATHCVTMCGGFAGLTQAGRRAGTPDVAAGRLVRKTSRGVALLLSQNAGRIASYSAAGVLAGGLGAAAGHAVQRGQAALEVISGVLLLGVGLFLAGLLPAYATLERLGAPLFRKVEPLARKLLPLRTPWQAALFGIAWGLLPCGLVYSALGLAAASGSAGQGALTMAAFGAGTLPALLSMGVLADTVAELAKRPLVRRGAGLLLVAFGVLHVAMAAQRLDAVGAGANGSAVCCAHAANQN